MMDPPVLIEDGEVKIYKFGFKIPLMSKRDVVCSVIKNDDKKYVILKSVEHPSCPETKGVIRANMIDCYKMTKLENGHVEVLEISSFDLKGYVPKSFMNMILGSMATDEYKKL